MSLIGILTQLSTASCTRARMWWQLYWSQWEKLNTWTQHIYMVWLSKWKNTLKKVGEPLMFPPKALTGADDTVIKRGRSDWRGTTKNTVNMLTEKSVVILLSDMSSLSGGISSSGFMRHNVTFLQVSPIDFTTAAATVWPQSMTEWCDDPSFFFKLTMWDYLNTNTHLVSWVSSPGRLESANRTASCTANRAN